jgi:exonuclease SbcD
MRILHFADLHLGVETYGRPDPATGLNSRLLDFLCPLDELIDYAVREDVDLILFAGDAYKGRQPSQTHQREFATRIRRLLNDGISVFLLAGNHDVPATTNLATTLDIFRALTPAQAEPDWPTLTVADSPGPYVVHTQSGAVQIVALPWPTPSRYLTATEFLASIFEPAAQSLETIVPDLIERIVETLDSTLPTILAGHLQLTHSLIAPGSEQSMTVGRSPSFAPEALHPQLFDYVALGHIHRTHVIEGPTPIVYAGSLQPIDFGEEDEPKGFYTIELDVKKLLGRRLNFPPEFHPVTVRPFVTITVAARDQDPTQEVLATIAKANVAGAIVRVLLRLSRAQAEVLREVELRKALSSAHFIAYIKNDITDPPRSTRLPAGIRPESLSPLDALKLYFDQRHTPEHRQEVLLAAASKLIEGSIGSGERSSSND